MLVLSRKAGEGIIIGDDIIVKVIESKSGNIHAYEHLERLGRDYIRLATTGGEHFPDLAMSIDHVTLVTVDNQGVDIANLRMSGIFDKTGHIPLAGDDVCYETAKCADK